MILKIEVRAPYSRLCQVSDLSYHTSTISQTVASKVPRPEAVCLYLAIDIPRRDCTSDLLVKEARGDWRSRTVPGSIHMCELYP